MGVRLYQHVCMNECTEMYTNSGQKVSDPAEMGLQGFAGCLAYNKGAGPDSGFSDCTSSTVNS